MEFERLRDGTESTPCGHADDDDDFEADAREFFDVMGINGPRMLSEMCKSCIMRSPKDGQIMVGAERVAQLINQARQADSYVICHSTIHRSDDVPAAICRGFADAYSTNFLRVMERVGGFDEVAPPADRDAA